MKTVLKEHALRLRYGGYTIRFWIPDTENVGELRPRLMREIEEAMAVRVEDDSSPVKCRRVADRLIEGFNLNAVEVVDADGNGAISYDSWP